MSIFVKRRVNFSCISYHIFITIYTFFTFFVKADDSG